MMVGVALSDSHLPVPISPSPVDYSVHYPQLFPSPDKFDGSKRIEFADVGCGFGGLLISLSTMFPETLMIGMELRDKVTEYVKERVVALRSSNPGQYENVSVVHVEELGVWMKSCLEGHPLFEAVTKEELEADAVVKLLSSATGEGQKVARNGGANVPSRYVQLIFEEEVVERKMEREESGIVEVKKSRKGVEKETEEKDC
ncbi:tRNA (guanine-N(7)-)-methyltransferase [Forsythia ovata]|uniref:tRNA (guanine(46)-N(7))-methyltransferase n=1 Tax=Forsythia ovata TaxID=205694 RepID=A0ABD1S083_9LAMI